MIIRTLQYQDLEQLTGITPAGWNSPVERLLESFLQESRFQAVVAEINGTIAGVGHVILFGKSGWLGNIIVKEEFRRKGIGRSITENLIGRSGNCSSILLVATADGLPVYAKLGFTTSSHYRFFRGGSVPGLVSSRLKPASPSDFPDIVEVDKAATGESREWILNRFMGKAVISKSSDNQRLTGFYLPDFGAGLIVSEDEETGINLLKYKLLNHPEKQICIPEENSSAAAYLEQNGYTEYLKAPRMYLKNDLIWNPRWIFSRSTGYCG